MDALFNAISGYYPEYTAAYNEEQAKFERGRLRSCIHKRLSKVWKWEILTIASAEEREIS
jgi:hypothetical protein